MEAQSDERATLQEESHQKENEAVTDYQNQQADWDNKDEDFLFGEDTRQLQQQILPGPGAFQTCCNRFRQRYLKICCCVVFLISILMFMFLGILAVLIVLRLPTK